MAVVDVLFVVAAAFRLFLAFSGKKYLLLPVQPRSFATCFDPCLRLRHAQRPEHGLASGRERSARDTRETRAHEGAKRHERAEDLLDIYWRKAWIQRPSCRLLVGQLLV